VRAAPPVGTGRPYPLRRRSRQGSAPGGSKGGERTTWRNSYRDRLLGMRPTCCLRAKQEFLPREGLVGRQVLGLQQVTTLAAHDPDCSTGCGRSPLNEKNDFAGDPIGDDLVVLDYALSLLDAE
jgi:hypothetical protein